MVSVLIANPGIIHSIDEFSNALNRSTFAIRTNPLKATPAQAAVNYVPYTEAQRARLIAAQISEVNRQISDLRHQALAYQSIPGNLAERACKNCEDIFKRAVAPALLQGEAQVLEIRLDTLKRASTPDWAEQVQRELNTGHYDVFIKKYRSDLRLAMRQVLIESIGQAEVMRMTLKKNVFAAMMRRTSQKTSTGPSQKTSTGQMHSSKTAEAPSEISPEKRPRV